MCSGGRVRGVLSVRNILPPAQILEAISSRQDDEPPYWSPEDASPRSHVRAPYYKIFISKHATLNKLINSTYIHTYITSRQFPCGVLTGHGCFGRYLCQIGRESSSGCQHCSASVEDTALHTLQECPAWDGERRVLGANIGPDLSLPAVVQAMVGGQTEWDAIASFCEAVMSAKEATERERERAAPQ
ncbi:hypothetical protein K1T71_002456 [Dendrolimus kikuchii]|uniref:Uncharacterized protein n=1 Tax=Dendrolimus kikuchii TaxID=765133 RepID=A0ACC1DDB0_9NEOP|nr:hypothetical protein K1T71_002456 [Dendrolimus kikuchii]